MTAHRGRDMVKRQLIGISLATMSSGVLVRKPILLAGAKPGKVTIKFTNQTLITAPSL
jgi:hypothetical protein